MSPTSGSEYMQDAAGVFARWIAGKIAAGETDYYGYHNAEAIGKMEVALDLITLVRTLESDIGDALSGPHAENQYAANAMRMFLQTIELWDEADKLYDELCSWRRLRFERHSS